MENIQEDAIVGVGDIITIDGIRYRLLKFEKDCTLIDTSKERICLLNIGMNLLVECITSNEYKVSKYKNPSHFIMDDENERYQQRLAMVNEIKEKYHGDIAAFYVNHSSDSVAYLCDKYGIGSPATFWRIIRRYMQSGYSNTSLMPRVPVFSNGKKFLNGNCGAKEENGIDGFTIREEDETFIKEAIDEYLKNPITLDKAYRNMIDRHYTHTEIDENGQTRLYRNGYGDCPSEKQFLYRYYKHTTEDERDTALKRLNPSRTSDDRLLASTELDEVSYPGEIVQIDACEIDLSLLDQRFRKYTVGRPTLYAMKDVYSKKILAIALGFKKNSVEALSKLMANLCEDKTAFCEKYGIFGVRTEHWHSGVLPTIIRTDRGSDFKSKAFRRICNELGITLQLVRGGSGSLKGSIEQFFHQYHSVIKPFLHKLGIIEKDIFSKHHTEAVLNIYEAMKISIIMVVYYNNILMDGYEITHDMALQGVVPTPNNIWDYGVANIDYPRKIENSKQYLRTLYIPGRAKINDKGIEFQKLHYWNANNAELFSLMKKSKANKRKSFYIDIFYDPSSIVQIHYYDSNHDFVEIGLNDNYKKSQDELKNYSFAMVKAYRKGISRSLKASKEEKRNLKSERDAHIAGVVADALVATPTKPIAKNMREHRSEEEFLDSYRGSPTQLLEEQELIETADTANLLPPDSVTTETNEEENAKEEKHGYSQEEHYASMLDCL